MDDVSNAGETPALAAALRELETRLRERFGGLDRAQLRELPVVRAYEAHYRPFGQNYHVLRQVESVALKGRPIASPGGSLVSAMFAAELSNLLLTAGHDVDAVLEPLCVDCSRAGDRFIGIGRQEREVRPGDMLMRDGDGIISAVLYGPDARTRLSATTTRALFVTYAPNGIDADTLRGHLEQLAEYVRLASPAARTVALSVV